MYHKDKYEVYRTDAKNKNGKIDMERAVWDKNESKHIYTDIDTDTIEYRTEEAIKNENSFCLDLKGMKLDIMPNINKHVDKKKIICLFLNDNIFTSLADLSIFENLEVLDIANNKINHIGFLPKKLLELNCSDNELTQLPPATQLHILVRLNCSNNKIINIPHYLKLTHLICDMNKITNLKEYDELEFLNCSDNKIEDIHDYKKLKTLIINNNPIRTFPNFEKLLFIEFYDTLVTALPYMPELKEVFCSNDITKQIANEYMANKECEVALVKKKTLHIYFYKK